MTARQPIHKTGNLLTKDDVQPTGIISEPPRSWKRPRDHVDQQEVSLAKKKKLEIFHENARYRYPAIIIWQTKFKVFCLEYITRNADSTMLDIVGQNQIVLSFIQQLSAKQTNVMTKIVPIGM